MGDVTQLGDIVAGAFAHPEMAGRGEYLPLVGDFMSFNEIIDTQSTAPQFLLQPSAKGSLAGFFPEPPR